MQMHTVLVNPSHPPIKYIFVLKYIFVIKYTKFITHIQPNGNNLQHHKHIAGT